jgi:hypothetical protein
MDALTLTHTAISLFAIFAGFVVLAQMLKNSMSSAWTGIFLATTLLTSATGFIFFSPPNPPTPAQVTGVITLIALVPTLYGLYVQHLAGAWRLIYLIGAVLSLYLNVVALVAQLFLKVPPLQALAGNPPSGPVFGAAQLVVLTAFALTGWQASKTFRPLVAISITPPSQS